MSIFRRKNKIDTISKTIKETKEDHTCQCDTADVKLTLNACSDCCYGDVKTTFFVFRGDLYFKANDKTSAKNVITGVTFINDIKDQYPDEFEGKSNQVLSKVIITPCEIDKCLVKKES